MNTGDLCTIDEDGYLYIRGRNKNMILGPSGQNIYPEEIEQKINNLALVSESIVVEANGKLEALIYPDLDLATKEGIAVPDLEKLLNDNIKLLNKELPSYSQIAKVRLRYQEFEKTPKRSIKRYLYQNGN
jgi:long-chain acyl-CoA synthetase